MVGVVLCHCAELVKAKNSLLEGLNSACIALVANAEHLLKHVVSVEEAVANIAIGRVFALARFFRLPHTFPQGAIFKDCSGDGTHSQRLYDKILAKQKCGLVKGPLQVRSREFSAVLYHIFSLNIALGYLLSDRFVRLNICEHVIVLDVLRLILLLFV